MTEMEEDEKDKQIKKGKCLKIGLAGAEILCVCAEPLILFQKVDLRRRSTLILRLFIRHLQNPKNKTQN